MTLRPFRSDDAAAIVQLLFDTVHRVNARDYAPEQLRAWVPEVPDAAAWSTERLAGRFVLVAESAGTVTGFATLGEGGLVDCLFVHHDWQRRGVGRHLLAGLEAEARARGWTQLHTQASITAQPFFAAQGFSTLKKQSVQRCGQVLTNFVMAKALIASEAAGSE